tara:strand:+ start:1916 stop:2848 length:933 start_codon:yes stop_codon:yes gene_type:complete
MKILKPKFWDQNYYTFLSIFFFPLSLFYRVILFLRKINSEEKEFPIPIICVGNIYIGGTGKTPVSLKVCKILKELGQNPVIVKKDYKSHDDEISLIKKYNKVLTAKNRADAINLAMEKKFNFIVLDDGYQDLTIKKNFNIICFHSRQKLGNGHLIPAGPLRESPDSLKNCNTILINGKKDLEFEQKLKKYNSKLNFFYYHYYSKNIEDFKNKKLVAFAGIGNTQNFFNFLKENHLNVVKEISYPDHYKYTEKDLKDLVKIEKLYNAKLITTEKDYLRISPFTRKTFGYIRIDTKFENEENFKNSFKKLIV